MTKKDYIKLAAAIRWARPSRPVYKTKREFEHRMAAWYSVAEEISKTLAADNGGFNATKFAEAAGMMEWILRR